MMQEHTLDEDLVAATRRGDARAFGRLVERHHGAVTAVAFSITRELALAEDLAQDTFVAAWTKISEVREPSRVRAWLCTIARNLSRSELRRSGRVVAAVDERSVDQAPTAEQQLLERESRVALHAAMSAVPDADREALVLFYWHDRSILDVAEALDISAPAAQKRISRARGHVADELAARIEDAGRRRRAATVAAAAVVGVVASLPKPAVASGGAGGRHVVTRALASWLSLAAVVVIAIGGLVVWSSLGTRRGTASTSVTPNDSGAQGRPISSSTTRVSSPNGSSPNGSGTAPGKVDVRIEGGFGTPDTYELTLIPKAHVAVALAGGHAQTRSVGGDPLEEALGDVGARQEPAYRRHVRGRVLDEAGAPIPGAIVLVADRFEDRDGDLVAGQGATADESGEFDVAIPDSAARAIALHPRIGWSATVAVPGGSGDVAIEIRVPRPAGLSGQVRRAQQPLLGEVSVTSEDRSFKIGVETDDLGQFTLPLLQPGRYQVAAWARQTGGNTGALVEQTVSIERDATNRVTLDIPTGTLVRVTRRGLPDDEKRILNYYLVSGRIAGLAVDKIAPLVASGRAREVTIARTDVESQFHDVAPGEYTSCSDGISLSTGDLAFVCKGFSVNGKQAVVDVQLE